MAGNQGPTPSLLDKFAEVAAFLVAEAALGVAFGRLVGWISAQWSEWGWVRQLLTVLAAAVTVAGIVLILLRKQIKRWWQRGLALGLALLGAVLGFLVWDDPDPRPPDDCGARPSADAVEVMVVWTHPNTDEQTDELDAFCTVAADYPHGDVEVVAAGEDVGAELGDAIAAGDPPDVAIVPQPSLVRRLGREGHLVRVNRITAIDHDPAAMTGIPAPWTRLVTTESDGEDPVWGAFVKGANKSIFWYLTEELADREPRLREGWEWDEFMAWIDGYATRAVDQETAPLTFAAAAGWPLTDWFENQLALAGPGLYQRIASGERVSWDGDSDDHATLYGALDTMARLWERHDVFPGGGLSPANTRPEDLDDRLSDGTAALVFHPSFLAGPVADLYPDDVRAFRFPGLRIRQHLVVGGDIAVVPEQESSGPGERFVDWLTEPGDDAAMVDWSAADPGYLAPNWGSPEAVPPDGGDEDLRQRLTNQLLACGMPDSGCELFFDLSDDRFATQNPDGPKATWDIFSAFFEGITQNGDRHELIEQVIDCLQDEYTDGRQPCPLRPSSDPP